MRSSKFRHAVEAALTVLLFSMQNIVYGGPFISVMFIPLFGYLIGLKVFSPYLERDVNLLLFAREFMFGRVVALIGLVIFLLAIIQLLKGHPGLVLTGLYSAVRHPQYTGITVMTLRLTIMVLTLTNQPQLVLMWLMQFLGYVVLARYEEWHLEKKYGDSYHQYKRNVPFMFPVKCPLRIPETLFTISVSIIIAFSLLIVSPNFPRF